MRTRALAGLTLGAALIGGTAVASAQYYGSPPPPPQQRYYDQTPGWDTVPAEFRQAMHRGFEDGIRGARKDFENHRRADVNNRDEYRNPKFMRPEDRHEYREGFRRGYYVAVQHMYGPGRY